MILLDEKFCDGEGAAVGGGGIYSSTLLGSVSGAC